VLTFKRRPNATFARLSRRHPSNLHDLPHSRQLFPFYVDKVLGPSHHPTNSCFTAAPLIAKDGEQWPKDHKALRVQPPQTPMTQRWQGHLPLMTC
jgi:hypothetical protein